MALGPIFVNGSGFRLMYNITFLVQKWTFLPLPFFRDQNQITKKQPYCGGSRHNKIISCFSFR